MCSRLTDRAPSARQSSPCCLEVYTWLLHTDSPAERPSPAKPHVKQRRTRKRSHTPSLDIAQSHRSNYFGWMLQGADLYSELVSSLTRCTSRATQLAARLARTALSLAGIGVPARRNVPAR